MEDESKRNKPWLACPEEEEGDADDVADSADNDGADGNRNDEDGGATEGKQAGADQQPAEEENTSSCLRPPAAPTAPAPATTSASAMPEQSNAPVPGQTEQDTGLQSSDKTLPPSSGGGATPTAPSAAGATAGAGASTPNSELTLRFQHLKDQFEKGLLSREEYKAARTRLIDSLTGTTSPSKKPSGDSENGSEQVLDQSQPVIQPGKTLAPVPHRQRAKRPQLQDSVTEKDLKNGGGLKLLPKFAAPPKTTVEPAVKHIFIAATRSWISFSTKVKVNRELLGKNGERKAFHLQEAIDGKDYSSVNFVAKVCLEDASARQQLFRWVEDQMYSREWAAKFNEFQPPKKAMFVDAWLLELVERPDRPLCAVEQFLSGPFKKHNSKSGLPIESDRNTPQAFSHFTYEASDHKLLICNIKGVGDVYVDPKICLSARAFPHQQQSQADPQSPQPVQMDALADESPELQQEILSDEQTIQNFLSSHRCNPICVYLKLPIMNALPSLGSASSSDQLGSGAPADASNASAAGKAKGKAKAKAKGKYEGVSRIMAERDEMREAGRTVPAVTYMPRESVNMMRALQGANPAANTVVAGGGQRALPYLLQCCSIL